MAWQLGVFALFIVGGLFALQGPINAYLAKLIGSPIQASFVSFSVGTITLCFVCLVTGVGLPSLKGLLKVPPQWLVGGLFGAAVVTTTIFMVPRFGIAAVLLVALAGQLFFSLILDHFALLGLPQTPLDPWRVLGVTFVIFGAFLCNRHHWVD
jgi:transporter family-2 protein